MLQHKLLQPQPDGWQQILADAVRDPYELLEMLNLSRHMIDLSETAAAQFPLRVPRGYVARMRKGDENDPLLRQVLPIGTEMQEVQGFTTDPVGDHDAIIKQGLLQKYHGRVLIMTTAACAIHCRYCFRRHFPYHELTARPSLWQPLLNEIAQDANISEVILSGGDPLSLGDSALLQLMTALEQIPHLKRLRIHSRYPIVLPERINEPLLEWFKQTRLTSVMVIHSNHANEIDASVKTALHKLKSTGMTLLNQAVLLHGVNDDGDTLCHLSEALFETGVMPYYLHKLDKVEGAAHFDADEDLAKQLVTEMRKRLPGYLVPKLVQEVAGTPYKQPL